MFDTSGRLQSVYTAEITPRDDGYTIEVPSREVELGTISSGDVIQVALLTSPEGNPGAEKTHSDLGNQRRSSDSREQNDPPVAEGETLEVTIESVGDQGDGVAKVDRGYVLIVPGTTPGEQPVVRVETVKENVGFAEVIE